MSFFQEVLQKGSGFLKTLRPVNSIVGIDIGTSAIKVVQLKKESGKIALETYGAISLGTYAQDVAGKVVTLPPETIAQAIADVLREANVTTKVAVTSIQSQATLIFLLELPEVSESELAEIIPNESRKYIPVALTEVSLDWYVVPKKQTYTEEELAQAQGGSAPKKMEVVVVAVRNETLAQYREISSKAAIESRGNEIEIFSAIRAVFHREIAPTMIIDYGAGTTKVSIVEYGVVRAYHVINRGSAFISESIARSQGIDFAEAEQLKQVLGMNSTTGEPVKIPGSSQEISEPEKIVETIAGSVQYVINETQNTLLQYERQSHKAISKIILTGGGSLLPGFKEKIQSEFGVETVFGNPFDKAEAPEFMRPVLERAGPEFTVAVGLALKDFI